MRGFFNAQSQFVAVVAAAVIRSNLAVVAILECGTRGYLQTARNPCRCHRSRPSFI